MHHGWYRTRSDLKVGKDPQSPYANQEALPVKQRKYVARLEELREALENSPFFKTHEVRAPLPWEQRALYVCEVGVGWGPGCTEDKLLTERIKAIKMRPRICGSAFLQ